VSSLISQCDDDEALVKKGKGAKTWRERGLREGLPANWTNLTKKFAPCTVQETKEGQGSEDENGDGKKEGEETVPTKASGGRNSTDDIRLGGGRHGQENVGVVFRAVITAATNIVLAVIVWFVYM
jgi:hypothetical protein